MFMYATMNLCYAETVTAMLDQQILLKVASITIVPRPRAIVKATFLLLPFEKRPNLDFFNKPIIFCMCHIWVILSWRDIIPKTVLCFKV